MSQTQAAAAGLDGWEVTGVDSIEELFAATPVSGDIISGSFSGDGLSVLVSSFSDEVESGVETTRLTFAG